MSNGQNSQSVDPGKTSAAGAVGAALATLVVFASVKLGVDYTSAEATAVTGALATVFGYVASVLRRNRPGYTG